WIFNAARRVPESSPWDYFGALKLAWAEPEATVADVFGGNRGLYRRFWEPLAVAVLNTSANEASASLLWPVVREMFGRGESACRPRIARRGLSESFVDPALAYLTGRGSRILFNHRLRAIEYDGDRAMTMDFGAERIPLSPEEHLILALPPAVAKTLVPDLTAPTESRPIVNAHFRLGDESREKVDISFLGLVGGACHWLFIRDGIASVTVSAADALAERSSDEIAARLWMELGGILGKKADSPPLWRIVKEKRATFAQTPEQVLLRPSSETRWKNLYLAGDWTKTGLPATIEGAIRSGYTAAGLVAERGAKS
ncbi:MAG: FAD-dependent oxidoreductase, partial [Rhodospirillales bacterium]|nr:FAD-dependent oxidoreductase [Rhodospirillales bacterium]